MFSVKSKLDNKTTLVCDVYNMLQNNSKWSREVILIACELFIYHFCGDRAWAEINVGNSACIMEIYAGK